MSATALPSRSSTWAHDVPEPSPTTRPEGPSTSTKYGDTGHAVVVPRLARHHRDDAGGARSATAAGDSASGPLVTTTTRVDGSGEAGARVVAQGVPERAAGAAAGGEEREQGGVLDAAHGDVGGAAAGKLAGDVGGRAEGLVGAGRGHARRRCGPGRGATRWRRRRGGAGRPVLEVDAEVVQGPQDLGVGPEEPDHQHAEQGERRARARRRWRRSRAQLTSQVWPKVTVMGELSPSVWRRYHVPSDGR